MSEIPAERTLTVIVQPPRRPGLLAGVIGCVLGFIGIFIFGFLFGPLGMLCAIVGIVSGIIGRSGAGVGVSLLAGVFSFVAAIKSPILWMIFGATMLASLFHAPHGGPQPPISSATAPPQVAATEPSTATPPIGLATDHGNGSLSGLPAAPSDLATPQVDNSQALAQLNHATDWVRHFDDKAAGLIPQLDATSERYHAITTQMESDAARRQSLWPMRHEQRDQLTNAISQGQAITERMHTQVSNLREGFDRDVPPLSDKLHKMLVACQAPGLSADMAPVCSQLVTAAQPFDDRYASLKDSFNRAETAYQQEQARQQEIANAPTTP